MRNRFVILIVALVALLIFSLVIVAQNRGGRGGQAASPAPDNRPFNAKDLAGIWSRNSNGYGGGGARPGRGEPGLCQNGPPSTPLGQKTLQAEKTSSRRRPGTSG